MISSRSTPAGVRTVTSSPSRAARSAAAIALLRGIDDCGELDPLGEEARAPVDLAQALLAVNVIAVFRAVAVARGPGDGLDHLRPLDAQEPMQLGLQARQSGRRDVVHGASAEAPPRHVASRRFPVESHGFDEEARLRVTIKDGIARILDAAVHDHGAGGHRRRAKIVPGPDRARDGLNFPL